MLCGALGAGRHWAERDRDDPDRRRERRVRIRLLNRVLAFHGVDAKLWGRGYLLQRPGGTDERAETLGAVWSVVERMTGGRCDPLDPALLAALRELGPP